MAIQFARMAYVSRASGGNACRTSSYNKRDRITDARSGKHYSFSSRGGNVHHEMMLPEGASPKFQESSVLWNAVELFENRRNSRLAKEIVLALPDDKEITLEDRIELCRRFVKAHFTDKGLAAQIDIHEPHHVEEKNWHAHLLVTTRRFSPDGEGFDVKKARDLDGVIRKGLVLDLERWGDLWRDVQNEYFKEKGLTLRVDPIGIIAQEHLGPVRMRRHISEVVARGHLLKAANREASLSADDILHHLTRTRSVFSEAHVDDYLGKHVPEPMHDSLRHRLLTHGTVIALHHKQTGDFTGFYTTQEVRGEEEKILRLTEGVAQSKNETVVLELPKHSSLSKEQKEAFIYAVDPHQNLRLIQGRAGTGKSTLMRTLHEGYAACHIPIMGLAPTHTVVHDMRTSGCEGAQTVHSFLFRYKNNRLSVAPGTVLLVDEAGMIDTPTYGELFKVARAHRCRVVLMGDDRQLSSVGRGGFFKVLGERFGSVELRHVRRQQVQWQRVVSEELSQGNISDALHLLNTKGALHWHGTTADALSALVEDYSRSAIQDPSRTRLILAHKNTDVDLLNHAIQRVRQAMGNVSTTEYVCRSRLGDVSVAVGDQIQFTKTDRRWGITNGERGTLLTATVNAFTIQKEGGEVLTIDPRTYTGLRLGYASTIYKGQGKTVDEAFVLHSPHMTENLSYVALTRQVHTINLYVSHAETPTREALIAQMSRVDHRVVSLDFMTEKQQHRAQKEHDSRLHKMAYGMGDRITSVLHRLTDTLPNHTFYRVTPPEAPPPGEVRTQDARERWSQEDSSLSLESLTREYRARITQAYKEKVGPEWPTYRSEIQSIASRAAQETFLKPPLDDKNLTILFAKCQYELRRQSELNQGFKGDDRAHLIKTEALVAIEGRLFTECRQEKDVLSASDIRMLQQRAAQEQARMDQKECGAREILPSSRHKTLDI